MYCVNRLLAALAKTVHKRDHLAVLAQQLLRRSRDQGANFVEVGLQVPTYGVSQGGTGLRALSILRAGHAHWRPQAGWIAVTSPGFVAEERSDKPAARMEASRVAAIGSVGDVSSLSNQEPHVVGCHVGVPLQGRALLWHQSRLRLVCAYGLSNVRSVVVQYLCEDNNVEEEKGEVPLSTQQEATVKFYGVRASSEGSYCPLSVAVALEERRFASFQLSTNKSRTKVEKKKKKSRNQHPRAHSIKCLIVIIVLPYFFGTAVYSVTCIGNKLNSC